ncbi:multidrug effflux MFS transporter [Psychrobium sp. 1_MG-2023]|uniref:multidrug effflux MFS transporter n=1 Tax=Psychrobium sp. 1_MG-2023 TaxID=3062624 RepID=UPI000CAE758D|nr:multidrug effflux MFS transporter [Psychrobium sp. 1_MG-2023]MDP2560829.1 multidrug effflux MFS transporter [Psychrobium sp. 1_MG-2023]PKF56703.1 Bcr/CflA family drug resistance efflux transporter [Alteromonadales bacterium alter-6D02]
MSTSVALPSPKIEFIALMALMMSLVAFSIDVILPAMGLIEAGLNLAPTQDVKLIVPVLLMGMGVGQLFIGPLSDSLGRKPLVYLGITIFLIATAICAVATSYEWMLIGRFIQGVGLAAPRVLSMAIIRDQYAGAYMARVMSFIMMFFILVPMLAPLVGQGILWFAPWQAIFISMLVMGTVALIWFGLRQPETLQPQYVKPFQLSVLLKTCKEVCTTPVAMAYTMASGIVSAAFVAYLSSAQALFQDAYQLGEYFALYFSGLAFVFGVASYVNGKMVVAKGMQYMVKNALCGLVISSVCFYAIGLWFQGLPSLMMTTVYFVVAFAYIGVLFGNLNSLAMEPLGHLAGTGAAIVGAVSTLVAVAGAFIVSGWYNATVLPLTGAFALTSVLAGIIVWFIEKRRTLESQ